MNWTAIKDEWQTTSISLIDVAEKHGAKLGTLKSRKSREGWKKLPSVDDTSIRKVNNAVKKAVKERVEVVQPEIVVKVAKEVKVARPRTNSPWLKHLPYEMLELMQDMENVDPLDILYDQIRMQWSIIIRAQEIMFVADKEDTTKFKSSVSMDSDSYDIHAAWDKHGKFMTAMSSAQKELRFLIQQFMTIAPVEDERRLRMAQIQASTELTNITAQKLKGNIKNTDMLEVLIGAVTGGNQ